MPACRRPSGTPHNPTAPAANLVARGVLAVARQPCLFSQSAPSARSSSWVDQLLHVDGSPRSPSVSATSGTAPSSAPSAARSAWFPAVRPAISRLPPGLSSPTGLTPAWASSGRTHQQSLANHAVRAAVGPRRKRGGHSWRRSIRHRARSARRRHAFSRQLSRTCRPHGADRSRRRSCRPALRGTVRRAIPAPTPESIDLAGFRLANRVVEYLSRSWSALPGSCSHVLDLWPPFRRRRSPPLGHQRRSSMASHSTPRAGVCDQHLAYGSRIRGVGPVGFDCPCGGHHSPRWCQDAVLMSHDVDHGCALCSFAYSCPSSRFYELLVM